MKKAVLLIPVLALMVLTLIQARPVKADGHDTAATASPVLSRGDRLMLTIPDEPEPDFPLTINDRGQVSLPEAGLVTIGGLSLDDALTTIRQQLSTSYRNPDAIRLQLIEQYIIVTVNGFVEQPGAVTLSATADIQTAISKAGGLRQGAQLDRLHLRRGSLLQHFDYKSYLDSGDRNLLPSLQDGDEIFVPSSPLIPKVEVEFDARTLIAAGDAAEDGNAVRIFGEVNSPGRFSFKEGQGVVDLIMRAGGVTRYAGVEKIRVMNGAQPVLFNLTEYLDSGNQERLPEINPGATVFVPIRVDEVQNTALTVYVMGEVAKPGAFELTEGATFFDVLANSGGPNRYAETRQLRLIRSNGRVEPFDLAGYTEGRPGITVPDIRPGDAIFVPEKADQLEKSWLKVAPERAVRIIGQVNRPGRYEWSDEMNLMDLLAHSGGPTQQGDMAKVTISRAQQSGVTVIDIDLESYLKGTSDLPVLPPLLAGDTITVPELPRDPANNKSQWIRQDADRSIYIMGSVVSPGRYAFKPELGFLDILAAADGPSANADIRNIRVSHRNGSKSRVSQINLALFFETGDDSVLPDIVPGDVIYVPDRNREWTQIGAKETVRVLGSVRQPGRYTFTDAMTLLDLLAEAGGPTDTAWHSNIVVVNLVDGKPVARSFDLVSFARTGDFAMLPVVRAGDTIYVPGINQSPWAQVTKGARDIVSLFSVFALLGVL